MATPITRSSHPDAMWPGVFEWFGVTYEKFPQVWKQIFEEREGDLMTEYLAAASGFGLARQKTESSPITYDSDGEDYVNKATQITYGLGYQVTREELEDNQYTEVSLPRAENLAFSMNTTIELSHANIFLNGFSNSFIYGDLQPLFSNAHPTKSGPQSNLPTVNADFSEASLEDMCKRILLALNSRGLNINIRPDQLIVSAADEFNATRVLQSQLRSGSANNDINAVKHMGLLPGGVVVNPYLGVESTQAWYVQTTAPRGLVSIWKRKPELEKDNDFDTENLKAKVTARWVPTVGDWRSVYGAAGF